MTDDIIASGNDNRRSWALLVVLLGQFMLTLDVTVVNVALAYVQRDLGLSGAELTWVNSAYLIAFGGLLLLFGRLGDLYGRRRIFLIGLGVFTAASLMCGLAHTPLVLIVGRFIQGIGAAAASSVVLAIIATEYPSPHERTKAMSTYTLVTISGGSLGLLVGGVITQHLDWHGVFLINIPIGLFAMRTGALVLREGVRTDVKRTIDIAGAFLVTSGAMALLYALVAASRHTWAEPALYVPSIAAVVLLGAFVAVEMYVDNPLMPMRIFKVRSLIVSSAVRAMVIIAIYSTFLFGTLDMADSLGFGPMRVGFAILPQTLMVAALSMGISARLIGRFGARRVLLAGLSVIAVGLWLFVQRDVGAAYWPGRFINYTIFGAGCGMAFLPLLTIAMSEVPAQDAGLGAAIINVSMQLAAAFGLAGLGSVAAYRTAGLVAEGVGAREALVLGYRLAYEIDVVTVLVGIVLTYVLLGQRRSAPVVAAVPAVAD